MSRDWQPLASVEPDTIVEARLQLHHAAAVVASAGRALLAPRADYMQTSLRWEPVLGGLFTDQLPGNLRAGLIFADRRIVVSGPKGDEELHLAGETRARAFEWLADALARRLGRPVSLGPDGDYALPEHAVATGAPFSMSPEAAEALGGVFANADLALAPYAERSDASPVRCWPHHFDIATLVTLAAGADPEQSSSVGLGLSPGDGGYPYPYFYLTPWPYPAEAPTASLPGGGHWHTEGWTGAVLPAEKLAQGSPAEQRARVERFLAVAFGVLTRSFRVPSS